MDTSEQYKKLSDEASPLKPDYVVERVKWYEDPVYIKMCDCEEIQGGWVLKLGDYVFDNVQSKVIFFSVCKESDKPVRDTYGSRYIWLPRQDQLQEMVGKFPEVFERFADTMGQNDFNYGLEEMGSYDLWETPCTSMEQLWLAFCMFEKYGKVWSGEEWLAGRSSVGLNT